MKFCAGAARRFARDSTWPSARTCKSVYRCRGPRSRREEQDFETKGRVVHVSKSETDGEQWWVCSLWAHGSRGCSGRNRRRRAVTSNYLRLSEPPAWPESARSLVTLK